jgi:hypothetical protein
MGHGEGQEAGPPPPPAAVVPVVAPPPVPVLPEPSRTTLPPQAGIRASASARSQDFMRWRMPREAARGQPHARPRRQNGDMRETCPTRTCRTLAWMNGTRRTLTVLGGAALLALALIFLFRGKPVGAARAPGSAEARATPPPPPSRPQRDAVSEARARRARDAMRDQILEAQRRRAAASPPKPADTRDAAAPTGEEEPPRGHYDPQYIRASFREDMFPLLRECYGDALSRQPKLAGKLVLKFAIVGDPSVGGVIEDADFAEESDIQDDEMRSCVRESLMSLTLDKPPEGGGKVTVTYPIAFSPDDDGEDAGGR